MQAIQSLLNALNSIIWSEYLLIPLLSIVGVYLTIGLRFMPWRHIVIAFKLLMFRRKPETETKSEI